MGVIGGLKLHTKAVAGLFVLVLFWTILHYNGWVLSTTLPRFTYMVVAAMVLFVIAGLSIINDTIGG